MSAIIEHAKELAEAAAAAARQLAVADTETKNQWLRLFAQALRERESELLQANSEDVRAAPGYGLSAAQTDRLRLDGARIESMAASVEQIASLPDPVGEEIERFVRPNGLDIRKVRVPLGVVFFIYESRPNVTSDAAAICVKSGNAVILRGGKEAVHTNRAIHEMIAGALAEVGLPPSAVQLVQRPEYELIDALLHLPEYINLVIPRGGESLIRRVVERARMPVLKHFKGVCHVYVHRSADLDMAERIVVNAKCQRPGVCNAAESLLVDEPIAATFLPRIAGLLEQRGVELRGCVRTQQLWPKVKPATEQDYATEYLDLKMSVRVVDDLRQAIEHIARYGSGHTDAIVASDEGAIREFLRQVDSSVVLANASTRFNDGGEFGFGAEVGISTDKFHARGPCGLRELTSYKYIVFGSGQISES